MPETNMPETNMTQTKALTKQCKCMELKDNNLYNPHNPQNPQDSLFTPSSLTPFVTAFCVGFFILTISVFIWEIFHPDKGMGH